MRNQDQIEQTWHFAKTITLIVCFVLAVILAAREAMGQDLQIAPPVLKREPPPKKAKQAEIIPVKATVPDAVIELKAPPTLDKSVLEAIRLGETVRSEPAVPIKGTYGSLVYTYGRGEPVLVCAAFRVCFVELQPGERIRGEPLIGDSVNWWVSPGLFGGEQDGTQVVLAKATAVDRDTNMVITTDRRIYNVRLVSTERDYLARVAFRYPEDESKAWAMKLAATLPPPTPVPVEPKVLPAILSAERFNFGYRIKGGDQHLRPIKVYDDSEKTYFSMPASLKYREAPALIVIGDDGKGTMSNYRVQEGTYILDRLIDRVHLVLGVGKKQKRVEITKENRG